MRCRGRPGGPAAALGPRPAADPGLPPGRGAAGAFASAAAVRGRSESSPSVSAGKRDLAAPGGDGQASHRLPVPLSARWGSPPRRSASPRTAPPPRALSLSRPPGLTCPPQFLHSRGQLLRLTALLGNGRRRPGVAPALPGALRALQGLGGAQGHGRRRRAQPRSHAGRGLPAGEGSASPPRGSAPRWVHGPGPQPGRCLRAERERAW